MTVTRWRDAGRRFAGRRAVRRTASVLLVGIAALAGAWLGLAVGAHVSTAVGPAEIGMSLQPSWRGQTVLDVRPLGTLRFDSHQGPLQLQLSLNGIHTDIAQRLLESPRWAETLPGLIEADLQSGLRDLLVRAALWSVGGAIVVGLVVFRTWRRALLTGLTSLCGLVLAGALAAMTFNPASISEPRYTGLLTGVPSLIGNAQSIVNRFSEYQAQLAKLVTNVSQLYHAGSTLPVYSPDPNTLRVLHVSDIHLNPVAWSTIRSLMEQFQIDMIIDTGDIADHGTKAENKFVEEIGKLKVPYVYVRGNHDSMDTQRAIARQKNAVVLDGAVKNVDGLRIYGVGDPRFTPDKSVQVDSDPAALERLGRSHASRLVPPSVPKSTKTPSPATSKASGTEAAAAKLPVGVVAVHDPTIGRAFDGAVPLVLSGHVHERSTEMLPSGTRLMIQGSTGSAGLRGLEHDEPTPIQASVLYFDRTTQRLQAWDDVTLGGLGEQWVQIQRHLESNPGRTILPEPSSTPTPSGEKTTATATPVRG
ncbi:metallophosphoesterase [Sphaerisporangium sp. B11E5]|uniref:metallophosphoesterase family protein n=1 Tax=Sphaerisporangium sp. B11E5 TaxID=3153563 RepID=UPI00325D5CEE